MGGFSFLGGGMVFGGGGEGKRKTDVEYPFCSSAARVGVFFPQRDEFFGEALGFLGFVPGCGDGFVFEEGGDEVAEESLSVGGFPAQVAVFEGTAGHWWVLGVGMKMGSFEGGGG